jgi:outer membrane protein insertion porin family
MKRSLLPLLLSSIVLSPLSMRGMGPEEAPLQEIYESKKIAQIDVLPENLPMGSSFDPKAVTLRLKTKVGDPFSQSVFDNDLKMLAEEYDRVEPQVEYREGQLYITLRVWPRPRIRTIQWEGNLYFSKKKLQKELEVKPNAFFNRKTFNKSFSKLKELYVKKGYFEAQLQYEVKPAAIGEVDLLITIDEGRAGRVEEILFSGFTKKEKSHLLHMIHTKKYNLFTSWLTGHGIFNEEAMEQDQLTIVNYLHNKGYADAQVTISIKEGKTPGKIVLKVQAIRGTIYHFGKVTFSGNTVLSDKEVERYFKARPEGIYSPEKLRETAEAIKELYGRKGYIEAEVTYEPRLIEDAPLYDVHFQIEEGQTYKIGLIHILGNTQTQTHVILRESLLVPGETFDAAKLKATQQRLENMGYFKKVNVYAVRTQEPLNNQFRDVYIEVEEGSTGSANLFFGLSSADSIFGGLDVSENNFNHRGLYRMFTEGPKALRGGGEYLHGRASFGARISNYSLSWLDPYFRDSLWRLGFELSKSYSTLQSKNYDIHALSWTLYTSYPFQTYWTLGSKYRIRDTNVYFSKDTPEAEKKALDRDGIISAIGSSLSYDSTDSALKPHRGYRSYFDLEFAGLGGDFFFFRMDYLNNYYAQIWKRGILKYRLDFHFIKPTGKTSKATKIPLSERLFLGGESSVRGYRAFDLGPHLDGDPTGGISSALFSVEYLQEIIKVIDAFFFVDGGSVSMESFSIPKYNVSYGLGLRLELINRVPVIVGMGFPVNPDSRSQVQRFFFSMGGQF